MNEKKEYLSDGVYAYDDGFHIVLETDGNRIFLDSHCLDELFRYVEKARDVTIKVERDATPGASAGSEEV